MVHTFYEYTISYYDHIDINFLNCIDSFQMLQKTLTFYPQEITPKKLSPEVSFLPKEETEMHSTVKVHHKGLKCQMTI